MESLKSIKEIIQETESRMSKSVEAVRKEYQSLRTGRASVALVEGIEVLYYGTPTPLKSLANLSTPDPRSIVIQPWDVSAVAEVEKGIRKSDLGLNPVVDGKIIRVPVPSLTDERRNELSKLVRKIGEEGKVSVRNARHEANEALKSLEKDKTVTEDELFNAKNNTQKLTDKYSAEVDDLTNKKDREIKDV